MKQHLITEHVLGPFSFAVSVRDHYFDSCVIPVFHVGVCVFDRCASTYPSVTQWRLSLRDAVRRFRNALASSGISAESSTSRCLFVSGFCCYSRCFFVSFVFISYVL